MKLIISTLLLLTINSIGTSFADETITEKLEATGNNTKRGMKKINHRMTEAMCREDHDNCMALRAKNKALEIKDETVDKVKEIKEKMD